MAQCEVVGCENEADPRLVHKYSGKTFCLSCARQINGWNATEAVVPIPEGLLEATLTTLPRPQHPLAGLCVPRQKRLKGPQ